MKNIYIRNRSRGGIFFIDFISFIFQYANCCFSISYDNEVYMLNLILILFIVAIIAGILGFGITNAVNHIAKFIFFLIVILFLIFMFYEYFSFHSPTSERAPPATQTPVNPQ